MGGFFDAGNQSEVMEKKEITVPFEVKEVTEEGVFEGHASVFGTVDRQNDVVEPGAFADSIRAKGARGVRLLWQHDPAQPIGLIEEIAEDARGLFVKGRLLSELRRGREARVLLKSGAISGLSVGFVTVKSEVDDATGVRRLIEVDLWEVSLVTFPANLEAQVAAVKAVVPFQDLLLAERARRWDRARAERRVRAWAGAEEGLSEPSVRRRYARAFLWQDPQREENFDAYKLQIADVIGADLRAVPRALFAAAAALMGARGGVDLPEEDVAGVRRHLERYYAKMREAFDDESILAPWKKETSFDAILAGVAPLIETERDFESFLREAGFSIKDAKGITALGFKAVSPQRDADGGLDPLLASIARAKQRLTIR